MGHSQVDAASADVLHFLVQMTAESEPALKKAKTEENIEKKAEDASKDVEMKKADGEGKEKKEKKDKDGDKKEKKEKKEKKDGDKEKKKEKKDKEGKEKKEKKENKEDSKENVAPDAQKRDKEGEAILP